MDESAISVPNRLGHKSPMLGAEDSKRRQTDGQAQDGVERVSLFVAAIS